ncbi:MAG: hypothetical protein HZA37_01040 [Parcubacteria group bacterium]|nr:hypothetical protein [Parcubacteria group bacterium]
MSKSSLSFAVVMTEENIVGCEIMSRLMAENLRPSIVIVERSERAEREKSYLKNDFYAPPAFADIPSRFPSEVVCVPNVNGEESRRALLEHAPDLILLDGSAIIKKQIFSIARIGTLNAHPGLLPEYRGVDSVRWSIYHGNPVGATCHFIDEGLDTGPIILREEVSYAAGEPLLSIRVRVMRICAKLMVEALQGLSSGVLRPVPQPKEGGYYSWAPKEVQEAVDRKLNPLA